MITVLIFLLYFFKHAHYVYFILIHLVQWKQNRNKINLKNKPNAIEKILYVYSFFTRKTHYVELVGWLRVAVTKTRFFDRFVWFLSSDWTRNELNENLLPTNSVCVRATNEHTNRETTTMTTGSNELNQATTWMYCMWENLRASVCVCMRVSLSLLGMKYWVEI